MIRKNFFIQYIFLIVLFFVQTVYAQFNPNLNDDVTDLMPSEILQYDSLINGAEFLIVFRPSDGKKYKLRTGLGCLRALLDPPENVSLMIKGFGDFKQGNIDKYRPMLFIQTPYHKAFCDIISIDMIK